MEVIPRKDSFGVDFPKDLEPIDKSMFHDFKKKYKWYVFMDWMFWKF